MTTSGSGEHVAGIARGEDARGDEAGRKDTGPKGESGRPTGTSTARDATGVDPKDPVTTPNERAKG